MAASSGYTYWHNKLLVDISEVVCQVKVWGVGVVEPSWSVLQLEGQITKHIPPVGHIRHHDAFHHLSGRLQSGRQPHEYLGWEALDEV